MEASMIRVARLVAMVAGVIFTLHSTPGWGQALVNPNVSDANHNTAGAQNPASGAGALANNDTGNNNTASGASALVFNSTGDNNTASGFQALQNNIAGINNTAVGFKALKKSLGTKNIGIGYQAG